MFKLVENGEILGKWKNYWRDGKSRENVGVGENSKPAGDGCHLLLAGIVDY